ncbi:MAG TPA: ATP-binding protein [Streptosporangiaceae bacterium]|nr:ATP-binding protein [Streptosporangiaceae bacterium]
MEPVTGPGFAPRRQSPAADAAVAPTAWVGHHQADAFHADLPADLASARRARSAVRQALAAWGLDDPSRDAELLVSEIVANAAEHGSGLGIGLALSRHHEPGGQAGITCEVTDTSPAFPSPRQAGSNDERGRGMAIVAALATASGVRTEPTGKTTWFTLAISERIQQATRQAEPEAEPGA